VEALHTKFPRLTYDVTTKLLRLVWAEQRKGTPRKAGNTACPTWQPNHLAVGGAGGFACQPIHSHLLRENFNLRPRATIPDLDEPWYC